MLPAEVVVEQVQLMVKIVLALLAQPFGEDRWCFSVSAPEAKQCH